MAKKNALGNTPKNAARELVEKNLESILITIQPGINKKKVKGKIKRAGKILLKGIKTKKAVTHKDVAKEVAPTTV
ncbi:MAG: hypothetical protein H7258_10540 [Ferruginibacter sp.]|nr:hypothetical protein [Ferruginibacter sp.]